MKPPQVSGPSRTGRSKVKTGCRTCKIRKIKCDEARPACKRCVSTGRTCEGYGIWGGGNGPGSYQPQTISVTTTLMRSPSSSLVESLAESELWYFDWFRSRTTRKLAGPFDPVFWESLVLRASLHEPAILHAALALSSAHKRENRLALCPSLRDIHHEDEETFILHHYSKAIRYLQPHFDSKRIESVRVALISSMIFTLLEYMRNHFQTGNAHLKSGFRLIGGLLKSDVIDLEELRDPTDVLLMEMFAKLNFQANMLGQGQPSHYKVVQSMYSQPWPVLFKNLSEARKRLDWLHTGVNSLRADWEQSSGRISNSASDNFSWRRTKIIDSLETWIRIYKASRVAMLSEAGNSGACGITILLMYYHMARITAYTCFLPDGENTYDAHTDEFLQIVTTGVRLDREMRALRFTKDAEVAPFTSDKGWNPPLYFAATKCRVHRIRMQAVRLLGTTSGKEGVWDSTLAALISKEIVRIEELGFHDTTPGEDDFAHDSIPDLKDLKPTPIPEKQRFFHVVVILPNSIDEPATIICKQRSDSGGAIGVARVYDQRARTWGDFNGIIT